jgi:ferric-dicitrate binding protein FerR (iron transport regulator)
MNIRKAVCLVLVLALVASSSAPVAAQAQRAGQVTAQIPQADLERPAGRVAAAPGTDVLWNDLVATQARGRARVTLTDGSILNVGSQSSLRIEQHNAQTRETEMTMTYGRLRARVPKGAQRFQLKTSTAVLGVIGTDFYVDASGTETNVIVFEGAVHVISINPAIVGSAHIAAGQKVTVGANQPPPTPQTAPPSEIQNSIQDTNVGEELPQPQPRPQPAAHGPVNWWLIAGFVAGAVLTTVLVTTSDKRKTLEVPEPPARDCPQGECR